MVETFHVHVVCLWQVSYLVWTSIYKSEQKYFVVGLSYCSPIIMEQFWWRPYIKAPLKELRVSFGGRFICLKPIETSSTVILQIVCMSGGCLFSIKLSFFREVVRLAHPTQCTGYSRNLRNMMAIVLFSRSFGWNWNSKPVWGQNSCISVSSYAQLWWSDG